MCCFSTLFSPFSFLLLFPCLLSCRLQKQWVTAVNLSSIGTEHFPGVSTGSNHTAAITSRRHYIIYHPSWHQSPVVTAPQPRWHPCCLPTTAAHSPHINISGSPGDTYKYVPQFHSVVRVSRLQPWSPSVLDLSTPINHKIINSALVVQFWKADHSSENFERVNLKMAAVHVQLLRLAVLP